MFIFCSEHNSNCYSGLTFILPTEDDPLFLVYKWNYSNNKIERIYFPKSKIERKKYFIGLPIIKKEYYIDFNEGRIKRKTYILGIPIL